MSSFQENKKREACELLRAFVLPLLNSGCNESSCGGGNQNPKKNRYSTRWT
jgi:hypothetical protein